MMAVNRRKRFVIYALVFMFGFLFLKNLSADILWQDSDNCDEIAHIHLHMNQMVKTENVISQKTHAEQNCHSGKSVFASSVCLDETVFFSLVVQSNSFAPIFNLRNDFQSPYLKGPKKPPRVQLILNSVS